MLGRLPNNAGNRRMLFSGVVIACLLIAAGGSRSISAQQSRQANSEKTAGNADQVARGRYLVEDVAVCANCHTPRDENGEFDRTRWLAGGALFFQPARPMHDWPLVAPRLAGLPPANDAAIITLLTTGIWTNGKPLRQPMPQFRMTRSDAEAVLAYLKSR